MKRVEPGKYPLETERIWEAEGVPVLRLVLRLPQPPCGAGKSAQRIRRYYQRMARVCFQHCEQVLLPRAQAACRTALASSAPLPCFSVNVDHRITLEKNGIWSLCVYSRACCGPGPVLLTWWGDTWELASGRLLPLSACFPRGTPRKRLLTDTAARCMEAREAAGVFRYWDSWRRDLRRRFDPQRFFLTDDGLSFFYGMYELGPASEGIPEFSLPYGPDGPILPR